MSKRKTKTTEATTTMQTPAMGLPDPLTEALQNLPEGVQVVSMEEPAELHRTIAEAVGEHPEAAQYHAYTEALEPRKTPVGALPVNKLFG